MLSLIVILLALLAIAGCASTPAPPAETAAVPVTSTMVTAPVAVASHIAPKPTATFVPLITPSPTPEGGALTNSIVPRIEIGVARQMADAGEALLVDVRTKATFEQAHIVGAISMPSSELLDRYHELPTDKLVIFYWSWKGESSSAGAALTVIQEGMTNVSALLGGWAAWQQAGYPIEGSRVPTPAVPVAAVEEMTVLGSPNAPVIIEDYSDFQWPYCRQHVLLTLPQLKSTYIDTGLVRYVVKDFPLSSHANATAAAGAARCAGAQGAYWAMHDLLFDRQQQWSPQEAEQVTEAFVAYAEELNLDPATFQECLDADEFGDLVRQDVWDGEQAGVQGTPSFRINGQLIRGAHPFETFQELIEAELEKTR